MGQKQPAKGKSAKSPRRAGVKAAPRRRASTKQKTSPPAGTDTFRQAVTRYEEALEALQQRRFQLASELFQGIIDDFPEERDFHERSRRYLQVCARALLEPPAPATFEERIYAATLAINAGSHDEAVRHLDAAAGENPDNDHVHYMLAIARADGGDAQAAAGHLLRALELNPDNRRLARHEPSFKQLRDDEAVRDAIG